MALRAPTKSSVIGDWRSMGWLTLTVGATSRVAAADACNCQELATATARHTRHRRNSRRAGSADASERRHQPSAFAAAFVLVSAADSYILDGARLRSGKSMFSWPASTDSGEKSGSRLYVSADRQARCPARCRVVLRGGATYDDRPCTFGLFELLRIRLCPQKTVGGPAGNHPPGRRAWLAEEDVTLSPKPSRVRRRLASRGSPHQRQDCQSAFDFAGFSTNRQREYRNPRDYAQS